MTTEKKTRTLLVAILDESGSMQTKVQDVIGGWNAFLEKQQEVKEDEATLILTKFNTVVSVIQNGLPIAQVPKLDAKTYTPGGMTALYDAFAESIRWADKVSFDRAICVVITDGLENSSRETSREQVQAIIKERTDRGTWSFVYLGEDPQRWAKEMGTSVRNTAQYNHGDPQASFAAASVGIQISRRAAGTQFDHVLDPDKKDDA
jgi:Mg-chelatase subunit ChlD